ncbi:MAG: hypothetical protein IJ048_01970 [Clostridia bacterium]|nr:hypothetical protein [Clostridia bacterium]
MTSSDVNIHAGHRQRMREKIFATGIDGMADHEIIEFLLFYAIPKRDVNPLAHRLLDAFGSLSRVLSASTEEILAVEGAGVSVAQVLTSFGTAMRRCMEDERQPAFRVTSTEEAVQTARAHFIHPTRQEMAALCTAGDGTLLNCVVRDWDIILTPENAHWLIEAVMDNRAHRLTLVWKRQGRMRRLVRTELEELNRLIVLLSAAEIYLSDLVLLYRDGTLSLRQTGVLSDEPVRTRPARPENP